MGSAVMRQGWLISWEGLDGVGKTTQMARVRDWLTCRGVETVAVREPGGTPFGEALRDLVLHRVEAGSAMAEFLAFAAARAELMDNIVLPALAAGVIVLMDRFIDSSVAYQAFGHGLDVEAVRTVNRIATRGREPDWTKWLKGEPFLKDSADRMERRGAEYFSRVEHGYAWLVQEAPTRWIVIDSRQNPDIIFDTLRTHIEEMILADRGGDDE